MKSVEEFFIAISKGSLASGGIQNSIFVLYGEDAFLTKRLKNQMKSLGFDLKNYDLKKSGPDADLLDLCSGTSLFVSQSAVWINKLQSPQLWKKESHKIWEQLTGLLGSADLKVFLQTSSEKEYSASCFEQAQHVFFEVEDSKKKYWLSVLNKEKSIPFSEDRLQFLASREEDLLTLENALELWSLGGDLWAEKSLGWDSGAKPHLKNVPQSNADNRAYLWVDATLVGNTENALKYLSQMDDQEPLMLLGLLSKSVRILAQLEFGVENFKNEPPFLVSKLRKLKSTLAAQGQPTRGRALLKACAQADIKMKTTRVDHSLILARLSEQSPRGLG
jgi:DNA polymerase III delta subunit